MPAARRCMVTLTSLSGEPKVEALLKPPRRDVFAGGSPVYENEERIALDMPRTSDTVQLKTGSTVTLPALDNRPEAAYRVSTSEERRRRIIVQAARRNT